MNAERTYSEPESRGERPQKFEVRLGQEGDLSREQIAALARSLTDYTFGSIEIDHEEERMNVKDFLGLVRKGVAKVPIVGKHLDSAAVELGSAVYPGMTRRDIDGRAEKKIEKELGAGNLLIGWEGDKPVGIMAIKKWGEAKDGREEYELTKATVLPEYRDKKYSLQLGAAAIQEIARRSPGGPICSVSKNPKMVETFRKYFPSALVFPLKGHEDHPFVVKMYEGIMTTIDPPEGQAEFDKMAREENYVLYFDPLGKYEF